MGCGTQGPLTASGEVFLTPPKQHQKILWAFGMVCTAAVESDEGEALGSWTDVPEILLSEKVIRVRGGVPFSQ